MSMRPLRPRLTVAGRTACRRVLGVAVGAWCVGERLAWAVIAVGTSAGTPSAGAASRCGSVVVPDIGVVEVLFQTPVR